jgi:stage V sporulation protein AE
MNYLYSFLIGGVLCIPAQILLDKTKLSNARILTGYVVCGVILSAIGLYNPLVDFASTGATVPLTGFGYSLARGVEKAIIKDGAFGIIYGGLAGTAAGISTAILFSFIVALIFKSRQK